MKIILEITEVSEVDDAEIQNLINTAEETGGVVTLTVEQPWPKMTIGTEFTTGDGIWYVFLKYTDEGTTKAKCVSKDNFDTNTTMQAVYFDCACIPNNIKFKGK